MQVKAYVLYIATLLALIAGKVQAYGMSEGGFGRGF